MKKIGFYILLAVMLMALAGCGVKNESAGVSIVCTAFPQYDFVRQITQGTDATLTMLIKPGSEAHSYEPTPNDRIKIDECDLFIGIGGVSETWAKTVLGSGERKMTVLNITESVELLDTADHDGHGHTEKDEHVWTSPRNAAKITQNICNALCVISPENAESYRSNTEKYLLELNALTSDFDSLATNAKTKALVFGDRNPFAYLARDMGLEVISPFNGCSEQTEASAGDIADIIDLVRAEKIGYIFKMSLSNEKIATSIADETGAKVLTLYSCHTLSAQDFGSGVTYIDLMTRNLKALTEALS